MAIVRKKKAELTTEQSARRSRRVETAVEESAASRILIYFLIGSTVLATLAYGAVENWAIALLFVGATVTSLLWALDAQQRGELRFSSNPLQLPVLGLILLGLIQLLPLRDMSAVNEILPTAKAVSALTFDPYSTRWFIVQLIALFTYFAAALTFINTPKRLRFITYAMIIFGFGLSIFAIVQGFVSPDKIFGSRTVANANPLGTYVNRHHFATLMVMIISLALGLLATRSISKEKRMLTLFAVVVMGIGLVLTSSRGGLLSFIAVLAFLFALNSFYFRRNPAEDEDEDIEDDDEEEKFYQKFLRSRWILAGGIAALILFIFAGVLLVGGGESLARAVGFGGYTDNDLTNGRAHFWEIAWRVFFNNPILGVGLNAFGAAYTRFDTWGGALRVEQAHNEYLQILVEGGLFALLLVFAFIAMLYRQGIEVLKRRQDRFRRGAALGALSGCLGVVIHSFFDFPLRTTSNALFFLTLVALATVSVSSSGGRRARRSSKAQEEANINLLQ